MKAVSAAAALLLAPVSVLAEELYNQDGVRLWASAQVVTSDAAVCRLEEGRYSAAEWAELKADHGQPLHVWRLEVGVANYSTRRIDYLNAIVDVVLGWPPCDDWAGPRGKYPGEVGSHGGRRELELPAGMEPGEEMREAFFMLAFHDQAPAFGRSRVSYDFADQPGTEHRSWLPGETFRDPLISGGRGPEIVVIPAGKLSMGCVSGVDCLPDELPVREETMPRAFGVSKHEVTFDDWDACMAAGGCTHRPDDAGWGRGRRPVIDVSWEDAQEYVQWLSGETGAKYRLLSESEWEYAARAGTGTTYAWGNEIGSGRANCLGCGSPWDGSRTAPVGSFPSNGWGLHDMHGNVAEWVRGCWGVRRGASSPAASGRRGSGCSDSGLRGGSWAYPPALLRSAFRLWFSSSNRSQLFGFRVARTLAP